MTTEAAEIVVETPVTGRKIVLKTDVDVMIDNIIPAGTTGFVIRHPSPCTGDQSVMYVAFDRRPTGFEGSDNSYNWFVDAGDVHFIESSDTDDHPVVHLIGNLLDDDGVILMDGSIGFVIGEDLGDEILTVAFPKQDFRRMSGELVGFDDMILHYLNRADLEFA